MAALTFEDGCEIVLDVSFIYAVMAAHIRQNGLWNSIDFSEIHQNVQNKFEGTGLPSGKVNEFTPGPYNQGLRALRYDRSNGEITPVYFSSPTSERKKKKNHEG